MTLRREALPLSLIIIGFALCYWMPVDSLPAMGAFTEALKLLKWYAREHVLLCLVPAFFIAGAVAVFLSKASVMRYLGAGANKVLAYGVAAVSGTILAVCSCTVLPLFAGIYGMGAGLGPATAFLYSGPAINILAVILTARVLGLELGVARAICAVVFAVVIGLLMHLAFHRAEAQRAQVQAAAVPSAEGQRPLWQTALFFALMIAVLVFANWGAASGDAGVYAAVYSLKWQITSLAAILLSLVLIRFFGATWWKLLVTAVLCLIAIVAFPQQYELVVGVGVLGLVFTCGTGASELREWLGESWGLGKQIMPLLAIGVLAAGIFLGTQDGAGLIPEEWIATALGGNSLLANILAAFSGALMYFATLTEVPIIEGLVSGGMGQGPALALLLAGPALSLPNLLVIAKVMGWRRTLVFTGLVVVMAALCGLVYGSLFA